jgi:hypothetical protein
MSSEYNAFECHTAKPVSIPWFGMFLTGNAEAVDQNNEAQISLKLSFAGAEPEWLQKEIK